MLTSTWAHAAAVVVLATVCIVSSMPQQRPQDRPFVDQFREYYPDDRKFFFNYTYGDTSKRVFYRSNTNLDDRGNRLQQQQEPQRPQQRPVQHVSDIDDNGGYHYEKPKGRRGPPASKVHFNLFNGNNY
ncbi:uncharacterized protein LOC135946026 [Cloeon dipterum]|uniref:uncharacterized protein LOC135946026 n=1 Tax=Cloeon dipterum TaxID=197152 RepID=UPI00321FF0ED